MTRKYRFFSLQKILILVLGTIAILYALQQYYVQRSKLLMYQQEIKRLTQENAMLEKTLKEADTPFMTEKIAREQLGMMKPGEYKVKMKEDQSVSH
ncbi:MAG TPA: septum formation initiator family protein [bacterium]|nr:septum formation initiator family protein [bacterium]